MDKIDRQLIALLQTNSRESTTVLAKKVGVARTTVHERIARLERNGIVRGYSVVLNRDPFEQYVLGFLLLTITKQKQIAAVEKLKRFPELKLCQSVNGSCDLICQASVPQLEDLDALILEMSEIDGITDIRSLIVTALKFDRRSHAANAFSAMHAAGVAGSEAG